MQSSYAAAGLRKNANGQAAPTSNAKKRRRRKVLAGLLLLLLLSVWYLWPSSQMAKVRQMQEELFNASPEERKEKLTALRAEEEQLSPEERQELRKNMGKMFQKKRNAAAAKYLAMSPADRRKLIDERLAREQARQQKAATGGDKPSGPGAPPGGPGGPRGGGTPEERDVMRRDFLLQATPEARAGIDQMRMDMAARRVELGLPASTRGFGGR